MNAPIPHEALQPAAEGPPWSQQAEQSVLGALMLDGTAYDRVSDILQPSAFYLPEHRAIFAAIGKLASADRPCDVVGVFEALRDAGAAESAGGLVYLTQLANCVPSAWNARKHAEIVAEKAAHRELIAAAGQALDIAREPGEVSDKLDRISTALQAVQRTQMRKAPQGMAELIRRSLDRYSSFGDGEKPTGWLTGVPPLDRMIYGLRPGKVYGIAARPSVGKSSAARTIALNVAKLGAPVLVLSQEMPADEVTDCAVAELGRIDSAKLQNGEGFTDDDWERLTEVAQTAADLPLWVDDEGGLTITEIAGKARMVRGLKVLVLDYLQLCTSTLKNANTNDQVAEISKGLKQLALRMGIAVVVLSQLNRQVESRADKEPQLSDLRDSGAIEQDLDVAVLLWTAKEDESDTRLVGWKVAKHRGGKKGTFAMRWRPATNAWFPSDEPLRAAAPAKNGGGWRGAPD